jgi:hypothetical protein
MSRLPHSRGARLLKLLPILSTESLMRSALLITAWLAFAAASSCESPAQPASQTVVYGYDLHGRPITRLADSGTRAVVLFFLATDCPISNRYIPEIQRLAKEFGARHVGVLFVYPNATETAEGIARHEKAYGIDGATLVRPAASLMAPIHPVVTPETAVLMPQESGQGGFRVAYVGRIDDWYVDIGRQRSQATRHDLEKAVDDVLSGQPAPSPGGPPVGCGIISEAALKSGAANP